MAQAIQVALEEPSRRRARRRVGGGAVLAMVMSFGLVLVAEVARPWLEELPAHLPWLRHAPALTPPRASPPAPDQGERKEAVGEVPEHEVPRLVIRAVEDE
jgi:hypothetical protein